MNLKQILKDVAVLTVGTVLPIAGVLYICEHEKWRDEELNRLFIQTADTDRSGNISTEELSNVYKDIWASLNRGTKENCPEGISYRLTNELKFFNYLQPKGIGDSIAPHPTPFE